VDLAYCRATSIPFNLGEADVQQNQIRSQFYRPLKGQFVGRACLRVQWFQW